MMPEEGTKRPLRRDAELNRQRILLAATEVFATRGVTATLDDVADHAGVGVGTVYRRFPNKDLLIEALFEDKICGLVELAQEAAGKSCGWEAFVGFLTSVCDRQAEDRGLRQVLHNSGYGRSRVAGARSRLVEPLTRLIDHAKEEGGLRRDFQVTDLPMIMVMVSGLALYAHASEPTLYRRYLDFVIDGLRERSDLASPTRSAPTVAQLETVMRGKAGAAGME